MVQEKNYPWSMWVYVAGFFAYERKETRHKIQGSSTGRFPNSSFSTGRYPEYKLSLYRLGTNSGQTRGKLRATQKNDRKRVAASFRLTGVKRERP
jgi:hypothetical protein